MLFGLKIVFSCCILNFLTIFYRILFWRIIYELIFLIINLFICVYKSEIISKLLGLSKKNIYIWQARKSEGGEGGGGVSYLHLGAITSPRCNMQTSGTIIVTRESWINTVFVCHSSCEDQHKCTPRDKRGTLNARLRWRTRGGEGPDSMAC